MATGPSRRLAPEPEVILPTQFFATLRRAAPRQTGEYRLLVAVLRDAITCFQKYAFVLQRREHRLFGETERWLMECTDGLERTDDRGFSFEQICGFLGLDAGYLRHGLQRWRDAQIAHASRQAQVAAARRLPADGCSARDQHDGHSPRQIVRVARYEQESRQ